MLIVHSSQYDAGLSMTVLCVCVCVAMYSSLKRNVYKIILNYLPPFT